MKKGLILITIILLSITTACQKTETEKIIKANEFMVYNTELSELENISYENYKIINKEINTDGDTYKVIKVDEKITDIELHTIDQTLLAKVDFDIDKYIKENYDDDHSVEILDELQLDEILVLKCYEPEGIPLNYITWEDHNDNTYYSVIQYNGKGE